MLSSNCPGPGDMIVFDVFGMETSLLAVMKLRRSRCSTTGDIFHGTYQDGVQSGTKRRIRSCEQGVRKGFAKLV